MIKGNILSLFFLFPFSFTILAASSKQFIIIQDELNSLAFSAVGNPGILRINGEGGHVKGTISITGDPKKPWQSAISCDLSELTTKISMRDKHMKEKYLELEKYPQTELMLTDVSYIEGKNSSDVDFKGNLNLHGVTKSVAGKADISFENNIYLVKAKFSLSLDDFNIVIPSFARITMAKEVHITISFQAKL